MFYDNELRFLQNMLNKCRLNNQIIIPSENLNNQFDLGYRKILLASESNKTFYDLFPVVNPNTIYRASDIFGCRYIFLKLPFRNDDAIFITGPYINVDITHQQIFELIETLNIPPGFSKELEFHYSTLPVVKEENHIYAMISTFAEFLWNGSENFKNTDVNIENSPIYFDNFYDFKSNSDNDIFDMQSIENRYNYENEIITAVSQGNIHKAEFLISAFSSLAFEKRVPDELRNIKNYCIIMNTLLRKAAESGGVHPLHINTVSSDFAKRIESITSVEKTSNFMREMLKTYCRLVKNNAIKNHSPLVQTAILYIDNDLTADLSLNAIAKINSVSAAYFSSLFKKETGQTLTDYVNHKRIKFAKHLLKSTNLQIQTIAQHCGILDLHYFCRIFKKITGITPTQYKNDISIR